MRRRWIYAILAITICTCLCACDTSQTPAETTAPFLSQLEAFDELKETAEENLALAIGIPADSTDVFIMNDYKIIEAVHDETAGYWYFTVKGKIPMSQNGLIAYIYYEFDAKVSHIMGVVTLGELKLVDTRQ